MRRRCDHSAKRTIWVPLRPNNSSREKIADIDGELINRANRLGGGDQLIAANETEQNEEIELEPEERIEDTKSEKKSEIIKGDCCRLLIYEATTRTENRHFTCKFIL